MKYILLAFELEVDIPKLSELAAQTCWTIQGVKACEHVDLNGFAPIVVGSAPDDLKLVGCERAWTPEDLVALDRMDDDDAWARMLKRDIGYAEIAAYADKLAAEANQSILSKLRRLFTK